MEQTQINIGSCRLDLANNDLECAEGTVTHLTQKSCEILDLLRQNQGELVSRKTLIETIWGENDLNGEKRLNDEIWKIRSVLTEIGADEVTIKTIPRKGYTLLISPEFEQANPPEDQRAGLAGELIGRWGTHLVQRGPAYLLAVLVPLIALGVYYHFSSLGEMQATIEHQQATIDKQIASKNNTANFFVQLFRVSDRPALSPEEVEMRMELVRDAENRLTSYAGDQGTYALLLQSVSVIYFQIGNFERAESSMQRVLELKSELYGAGSWEYFSSLLALAEIQWASLEPEEARQSYLDALAIAEENAFDQVEIAKVLNGLGVLYMTHFGDYEEAERLHLRALAIRQVEFGNVHAQVAGSLENLGYLYSNMKRFSEAAPMYEQAYEIRVKLNGEQSPRVARIMTNLADVYLNMEDYPAAIELAGKVEKLYADIHGEDYFARGISFVTLAQAYLRLNQLDLAQEYANRSLEILLKDQSKNSMSARHIGYAYMVMGDVIAARGKTDEAADYFQKGFYSFNEVYGLDHPRTREARSRLETNTH